MTDPIVDHAAAHERIADLALEPGGLEVALASPAPENRALAEHVAGCERCLADIAAWRGVHRTLGSALRLGAPGQRPDLEPIEAGADLRRAVLASASEQTRPQPASAPRLGGIQIPALRIPSLVLGLAAALVVAIGGTLLLAGPATDLARTVAEARSLSSVVAATNRVLADPHHTVVALATSDGAPAGSISWSSQDLVVLTSALTPPQAGSVYRCWLVGPSQEKPIGEMAFTAGTAYWVGSLDDWASIALRPGWSFYVTLESGPAGSKRSGPVVLEAEL